MFLRVRTCIVKNGVGETSVNSNLAITPSKMFDMTSQGQAVSLASLENQSFYTNEPDVKDMLLEYTRGIDMNTLWKQSRRSERSIQEFIRSNKNTRSSGEQKIGE